MKILVTGAAGAIGSHMVERLLDKGHHVIGVDVFSSYYSPEIKKITSTSLSAKGADMRTLDLSEDPLGEVTEGVDFIFHFAAQPGISASTHFSTYVQNNIVATEKLLEQAKTMSDLKGFVHISTSSVYGSHAVGSEDTVPEPTSWYGVTKLAAEQLALSYYRSFGVPVSVLRLFSVYGERERPEKLYHKLIKAMLEGVPFTLYEGADKHVRSYSYVGDIVDGLMLVFNDFEKAKGQIFNLGTDETNTTGEGIAHIEEIIGKKADFVILPKRSGDQTETRANITKMKETFGFTPKTHLRDGLAKEVAWYKDHIYSHQNKSVGLIVRMFAFNDRELVIKMDLLKQMLATAHQIGKFARIDILIPSDERFVQCDFGKTKQALAKEKLGEQVYVHEVQGDLFCDLLNYGVDLQYTQNIKYSMMVSLEAQQFLHEHNFTAMLHAMHSGAKVSGVAIPEFERIILDGRVMNTCAMWDTWALKEVGGFDVSARAMMKNEFRPFAGVEEIIPLLRIYKRFGKCIAPIIDRTHRIVVPDKEIQKESYEYHTLKVKTKDLRQRHYAESIGENIDVLRNAVMSQYKVLA